MTLDLGPPKQRLVLACLALARNRVVSTERLLAVVWGEDLPANATANLQVYLSRLRGVLRAGSGASPLVRRPPGYLLTLRPGELDADRFLALADQVRDAVDRRAWEEGVELAARVRATWRGEVLDGLGEAAWVRAEAAVLEDRRVEMGCAEVTALLGLGRHAPAAEAARLLGAGTDHRDDVVRVTMLALHQSGRTADALTTYAAHAARLDEELGLEPGAGLRDLQVALLRQEPWTLTWPGSPVGPAGGTAHEVDRRTDPTVPTTVPTTDVASGSLVGRRVERGVAAGLVDTVSDPVAGASRVLVLDGPAGIGKTRLAEHALAELESRGGVVSRGRCLEEDGAPAWWALRQVVRDLGEDPEEVLSAPTADADLGRFAVYERMADVLRRRAGLQPVGVLVDDLQWADPNSAACLAYLATTLGRARVLLVVTVRTEETTAGLLRSAAAMLRADGARQVAVPALPPQEVALLAGQVAGEELDEHDAAALAERTGGNPLFVCEYARLPRELRAAGPMPLAVRGVLARRVDALDEAVRPVLAVAAVAAVVDDDLDLDVVARVASLERGDLLDRLDRAADAAILEPRPGGAGYAFSHALLRDQVLGRLSTPRRQQLHADLARALVTAGGEQVTTRAQHLVAAGPLAPAHEVVEGCRAAALQAEQRLSADTAVRWWQQAYRALERQPAHEQDQQEREDLLVARVEAMVRAGRGQSVLDEIVTGLAEAVRTRRTTTAGRLAATLLRTSGTWPWVVFGQDPGPLLDRLAAVAPLVAGDPAAHARVLAALAVGRCYDPDRSVPEDLSRRALEVAAGTGDPDVLADALVGRVTTYVGVADRAEELEGLLDRLVALPRARGEADEVFALSARTMSTLALGEVRTTQEHLRAGVAGADRLRLPVIRAQLRWMQVGLTHWREGPEAALVEHSLAVAAHRRTELYDGGFGRLVHQVLLHELGRSDDAGDGDGDGGTAADQAVEPLVWSAAAASRTDAARAAALLRERMGRPFPPTWATLAHVLVIADLVADLGLDDLAPAVLDLLAPHAGRLVSLGQGPVMGPVDAARARLLHRLGHLDAAADALGEARELCVRNGGGPWVRRCDALAAAWGSDPHAG